MSLNIINISNLPKLEEEIKDDQYLFSTNSEDESFKLKTKDVVLKDKKGKIKKEDLPNPEFTIKELYEAKQPFFFYIETLDGKLVDLNNDEVYPAESKALIEENLRELNNSLYFFDGYSIWQNLSEDFIYLQENNDFSLKFSESDKVQLLHNTALKRAPKSLYFYNVVNGKSVKVAQTPQEFKIVLATIPCFNDSVKFLLFPMEIELTDEQFNTLKDKPMFCGEDFKNVKIIDTKIIPRNHAFEVNGFFKQTFNKAEYTPPVNYSIEGKTDYTDEKYQYNYIDLYESKIKSDTVVYSFCTLKKSEYVNDNLQNETQNNLKFRDYKYTDKWLDYINRNIPYCIAVHGNADLTLKCSEELLTRLESFGVPIVRDKVLTDNLFVLSNYRLYSIQHDSYLAEIIKDGERLGYCWSHYIDFDKLPSNIEVNYVVLSIFSQLSDSNKFSEVYLKLQNCDINSNGELTYSTTSSKIYVRPNDKVKLYGSNDPTQSPIFNNIQEFISIHPIGIDYVLGRGNLSSVFVTVEGLNSNILNKQNLYDIATISYQNYLQVFFTQNFIPAYTPKALVLNKEYAREYKDTFYLNFKPSEITHNPSTSPLFFFYPGEARHSHLKEVGRLRVVEGENFSYTLKKEIIPISEAQPYIAYFEVTPELREEILAGQPYTQKEIMDLLKDGKPAIFALKTQDGKYIDSSTGGITEDTEIDDPQNAGQKIIKRKNSAFTIAEQTFSSMSLRNNIVCPMNDTDECQFKFIDFIKNPSWYSPLVNVIFNADNSISLSIKSNLYLNWSEDKKWRVSSTKQDFLVEPTTIKFSYTSGKLMSLYSPCELVPLNTNTEVMSNIYIKGHGNDSTTVNSGVEKVVRKETPVIISCGGEIADSVLEFLPVHSTLPPIKHQHLKGFFRQVDYSVDNELTQVLALSKNGDLMSLSGNGYPALKCLITKAKPRISVIPMKQSEYDALSEDLKNRDTSIYLIYEDPAQ